ncbi:MAG: hypothetical protein HYR79_00985 [Nitrospirae bacterium]|nr:hypothetical protein [Nitrospirota bacterium]
MSKIMKQDPNVPGEVGAYQLRSMRPDSTSQAMLSGVPAGEIGCKETEQEREGYFEGFEAGRKAGFEQSLKEAGIKFQYLESLADELAKIKKGIEEGTEQEILTIAFLIARRILREEVRADKEKILQLIKEGILKIGQEGRFTIRLHPADFQVIDEKAHEFLATSAETQWLKFEPDASLLPGECLVENHERIVDLRLDSQLIQMFDALFNGSGIK